jgi:hypothetical protein
MAKPIQQRESSSYRALHMSGLKKKLMVLTLIVQVSDIKCEQSCINVDNKRCQNIHGKLDLIVVACKEHLRVNDDDDVKNTCTFLENCSDHPKEMKCMVSNTMVDCYHCIHRSAMMNYRTNHEKSKIFGALIEDRGTEIAASKIPRNLSISQVVIQGVGAITATVLLVAMQRGRSIHCPRAKGY